MRRIGTGQRRWPIYLNGSGNLKTNAGRELYGRHFFEFGSFVVPGAATSRYSDPGLAAAMLGIQFLRRS